MINVNKRKIIFNYFRHFTMNVSLSLKLTRPDTYTRGVLGVQPPPTKKN